MKPKKKPAKKKATQPIPKNYVRITTPSYGKALPGTLIIGEGRRPSSLKVDGRINLGKNILKILGSKFDRFPMIDRYFAYDSSLRLFVLV